MYRTSLDDPQGFWGAYAGELVWTRPWDRVLEDDFQNGKVKWFVGGKLNAAYNCLDRHLHTPRKDKVATPLGRRIRGNQDLYLSTIARGGLPFRQRLAIISGSGRETGSPSLFP